MCPYDLAHEVQVPCWVMKVQNDPGIWIQEWSHYLLPAIFLKVIMIGTKIKKYENINKYGAKTLACKECQMNLGQIRHIPAGTDKKFMYLKTM